MTRDAQRNRRLRGQNSPPGSAGARPARRADHDNQTRQADCSACSDPPARSRPPCRSHRETKRVCKRAYARSPREATDRARSAMTDMVIDASLALAWCFKDELTETATRLLEELRSGAAVPLLWPIEVANVLAIAERRKRITLAQRAQLIALLETLEIDVDGKTSALAFTRILDLAREQRLTAYDAAYLELAMRLGVPLASKDGDLCDAAERVGVKAVRAG